MRYLTLALNVNCYYCTKNEEILNGKLHFCAVYLTAKSLKARHNNLSAIEKWREKTGVVFHCICPAISLALSYLAILSPSSRRFVVRLKN